MVTLHRNVQEQGCKASAFFEATALTFPSLCGCLFRLCTTVFQDQFRENSIGKLECVFTLNTNKYIGEISSMSCVLTILTSSRQDTQNQSGCRGGRHHIRTPGRVLSLRRHLNKKHQIITHQIMLPVQIHFIYYGSVLYQYYRVGIGEAC